MKRAIILVMDSVGMGELPDADRYGDVGSHTLGNISKAMGGLQLPNLVGLGLGNIEGMQGYPKVDRPKGNFGKMAEKSAGKDTTTGHWEMSGLTLEKPFPTYPEGFPQDIVKSFEQAIGTKILGNIVASGTEIIKMLGEQHVKTGYPIVYTSADSVFQIAAHERIIPIERLYEMCQIARNLLRGEHAVGRVIARPFEGEVGSFKRTDRRHDFSLDPIGKTILDYTSEAGLQVKAVGKIQDIFNKKGITESLHTHNNTDGISKTMEYLMEDYSGILFTNLVDFDMLYGHRNNIQGYAEALQQLDAAIPSMLEILKDEDIIFITADHGCDPTTASTDHSREYVPLIVYGKSVKSGVNLGTRSSFVDLAATVAEYLGISERFGGKSFLTEIIL